MPNPVRITDNGTDISTSVDWTSIDMISVLTKEVSTLTFNVKIGSGQTFPAKTVPAIGDTINLYDSSGLIFGGTVTETEATIQGLLLTWQITCTDWSYLFDGTLVKKNYAMLDPHDIVVDIVTTFCSGKGFTTNHVQKGNFLVPSIKFNYQQPTKALQSLVAPSTSIQFSLRWKCGTNGSSTLANSSSSVNGSTLNVIGTTPNGVNATAVVVWIQTVT